jgi:hypothetical protein
MTNKELDDSPFSDFEKLCILKAKVTRLKAELEKHRWIPVEERLPEEDTHIVLHDLDKPLSWEEYWYEEEDEGYLREGRKVWIYSASLLPDTKSE